GGIKGSASSHRWSGTRAHNRRRTVQSYPPGGGGPAQTSCPRLATSREFARAAYTAIHLNRTSTTEGTTHMLPTSTNVTIEVKTNLPPDTEAVIVFAAMGGKISGDTTLVLKSAEFENAQRMIRLGVVKGKLKE